MANFEAFCWNFSSSTNPQIVRSGRRSAAPVPRLPHRLTGIKQGVVNRQQQSDISTTQQAFKKYGLFSFSVVVHSTNAGAMRQHSTVVLYYVYSMYTHTHTHRTARFFDLSSSRSILTDLFLRGQKQPRQQLLQAGIAAAAMKVRFPRVKVS